MTIEDICKQITDLLSALGVQFDSVELVKDTVGTKPTFLIQTPESELLIGENGETLQALFHILKRILHKKSGAEVDFSLDINNYRANKLEALKTKVAALAAQVRDTKTSVAMEPMSSYERLVVHNTLAHEANISTESAGEGVDRHIVIAYK